MAHTPGPWHANVPQDERYADGSTIREAHHGDIIATVARPLLAKGEVIANARLIAAAPELVMVLQRIVDHATEHGGPNDCEALNRARTLLANLA